MKGLELAQKYYETVSYTHLDVYKRQEEVVPTTDAVVEVSPAFSVALCVREGAARDMLSYSSGRAATSLSVIGW